MDEQRFDSFTRVFSACRSRRQALRVVAAVAAVGLLPGRARAALGAQATSCGAGLTFCPEAGVCVALQSDLNNCGACGIVCESGLVAVDCRGGACVRATCPAEL